MSIVIAISLIVIAGFINGSFALPTKHVKKWRFENIWLKYSFWAFVVLPWLFAYLFVPQILTVYKEAPFSVVSIMLIGGLIFGAGQVCFALALNIIGLGLGFVINLGLGIILGFLLPLVIQHPGQIATPFGLVTLTGCLLALIGLIFSNRAGALQDKEKHHGEAAVDVKASKYYGLGVLMAVFAGLSSAGQNFSFSMTSQMQQFAVHAGASSLGASVIMWPGFLLCAFVPYAIYMLYLMSKNKSFGNYVASGTGIYYLFAIIMGAFWYGSLIFYSKATNIIGALGPLVGWPLFMVLIILTSSFWGWRHHEWQGCSARVKHRLWAGLFFLILSVFVLGYSSLFHT